MPRVLAAWIGKADLLLRQAESEFLFEDFRVQRTTTYNPERDIPVAGELLEFCNSPEAFAVGYASLDGDCAPDDETAWFSLTLYPDTDEDGFGDESEPNELCLGESFPEGLVSGEDGFDCAPEDPLHWSDCGFCVDADGDGFGANCDVGESD